MFFEPFSHIFQTKKTVPRQCGEKSEKNDKKYQKCTYFATYRKASSKCVENRS